MLTKIVQIGDVPTDRFWVYTIGLLVVWSVVIANAESSISKSSLTAIRNSSTQNNDKEQRNMRNCKALCEHCGCLGFYCGEECICECNNDNSDTECIAAMQSNARKLSIPFEILIQGPTTNGFVRHAQQFEQNVGSTSTFGRNKRSTVVIYKPTCQNSLLHHGADQKASSKMKAVNRHKRGVSHLDWFTDFANKLVRPAPLNGTPQIISDIPDTSTESHHKHATNADDRSWFTDNAKLLLRPAPLYNRSRSSIMDDASESTVRVVKQIPIMLKETIRNLKHGPRNDDITETIHNTIADGTEVIQSNMQKSLGFLAPNIRKDFNEAFSKMKNIGRDLDINFQSPVPVPTVDTQRKYVIPWFRPENCIAKSYWVSEYSGDIFQSMRESESKEQVLHFRFSQSEIHRPNLLRSLKAAAETFKLSRASLHLSVYLLDRFMDYCKIAPHSLNLVVITCLKLSAKIEEKGIQKLSFADLTGFMGETYTLKQYKNTEKSLLQVVKCGLIRPTASTFAELFLNGFITPDDYDKYKSNWREGGQCNHCLTGEHSNVSSLCCCVNIASADGGQFKSALNLTLYRQYMDMVTDLRETLMMFVDLSLNDVKFSNVRPSITAAACIAAARLQHHVTPVWTPSLINLTECTEDVLVPHVESLMRLMRIEMPQQHAVVSNSLLHNNSDSGCRSAEAIDAEPKVTGVNELNTIVNISEEKTRTSALADKAGNNDDSVFKVPLVPKRRRLQ